MRPIQIVVLIGALLANAAPAQVVDPLGDPGKFRADIDAINRKPLPDDEQLSRTVGIVLMADAQKRRRCRPTNVHLSKLEPVTLDGMVTAMVAQGQIENAWFISARIDNCPSPDPIRVLVFRLADGRQMQAAYAGQGESLTWPTLAQEALRATAGKMVEKLKAADPKCAPTDLSPASMRIDARSPDLGPSVYGLRLKGWWSELWTFEACGHRIAVPIRFTPNGKGGAYWDIDTKRITLRS